MPDPIARKRLKKKMLDRWENEGGRIAANPTAEADATPTSEAKRKKLSSLRDNPTVSAPKSPTKKSKPSRK